MSIFEAIVLGIVQGLTEFLPISSTAHLRIIPALLGWQDPGAAYSAVIQLGTVVAVLVYFSKDIVRLTKAFLVGLRTKQPAPKTRASRGSSVSAPSPSRWRACTDEGRRRLHVAVTRASHQLWLIAPGTWTPLAV